MITRMNNVPDNMVAFDALGEVTKEDYLNVVMPAVKELVERTNELNYLMVVDTKLSNFTMGAWMEDVLLGFKEFTKWNRAAILTDSDALNKFTDIFSIIAPGEYRGFRTEALPEAIAWVSTGKKPA